MVLKSSPRIFWFQHQKSWQILQDLTVHLNQFMNYLIDKILFIIIHNKRTFEKTYRTMCCQYWTCRWTCRYSDEQVLIQQKFCCVTTEAEVITLSPGLILQSVCIKSCSQQKSKIRNCTLHLGWHLDTELLEVIVNFLPVCFLSASTAGKDNWWDSAMSVVWTIYIRMKKSKTKTKQYLQLICLPKNLLTNVSIKCIFFLFLSLH